MRGRKRHRKKSRAKIAIQAKARMVILSACGMTENFDRIMVELLGRNYMRYALGIDE